VRRCDLWSAIIGCGVFETPVRPIFPEVVSAFTEILFSREVQIKPMKSFHPLLLALILAPAFPLFHGQDVKPFIPVPQAPAPEPPPPPPVAAPAATGIGTTPGTTPGPVTSAPGVTADYVIGPQDVLNISVWKEPTVSGSAEVRPDGMITMPLLGDVKAVGFKPIDLAADLTTRLKKFYVDPLVTVTVTGVNSKHIFFAGEIRVTEMPYNPNITVLQAIISDGGPTAYANKKKIYILRTVNGKQKKIPFNYKKAVQTGDEQGITLLPGDTIVVP
jgi:polysaccharide biosynthesis/export protein